MSNTVHKFEAAGLGRAPFEVVGAHVEKYQACPGAPVQPGACCDFCGTGIMNVYLVRSACGCTFKVGSECVNKTGDAGLRDGVKRATRARKTAERGARIEGAKRDRLARERAARDERAAAPFARGLMVWLAFVAPAGSFAHTFGRDVLARYLTGVAPSPKQLALLYRLVAEVAAPKVNAYVGTVGERVETEVVISKRIEVAGYMYNTGADLWIMRTPAGHALVWKTSSSVDGFVVGAKVRVKATVKSHKEYRGECQTTLTRVKVL
jgi:hypothetical protein